MSRLYNYFLTGWINHNQTTVSINNAVTKLYITQAEADTILATPQT
jgi:hypothetical protein